MSKESIGGFEEDGVGGDGMEEVEWWKVEW